MSKIWRISTVVLTAHSTGVAVVRDINWVRYRSPEGFGGQRDRILGIGRKIEGYETIYVSPASKVNDLEIVLGENFVPTNVIVMGDQSFKDFCDGYCEAYSKSPLAVALFLDAYPQDVSRYNFVPDEGMKIVRSSNHYRSTIADLFFKYDLTNFHGLAYVKPALNTGTFIRIPNHFGEYKHLSKGWFAFPSLDEAMLVKMFFPEATIFQI